MKAKRTLKDKKASRLLLSFEHALKYKYVGECRQGLSAEEQKFLIDGHPIPHSYHPLSLHGTRTRKCRPRVQLTEEHAQRLQLPLLDERSGEVVEIIFPNGRVNYVLFGRRNSNCPSLRALHTHMDQHGPELDELLSTLDQKRVKDDLGGGRYIVSGFGNMGRNVSGNIRPPTQPSMRKSMKLVDHNNLASKVGGIFSHISECIAKHCGDVYEKNHNIMQNHNLVWPSLKYQQQTKWSWLASQFIVRRWGAALTNDWPIEKELVSAHTDTGDLDCTTFHCYRTGGGLRGKGGPVPGTDIAVFEHSTGGAGFRVKTCIEDHVVIVVLNSKRQLHGCILSADHIIVTDDNDYLAWTTRIIPYTPQGVYNWMMHHPRDTPPYTDIP